MKRTVRVNKAKTIIVELHGSDEYEYVVGKNVQLTLIVFILSRSTSRVVIRLAGRMARANIVGLVVGSGAHSIALHTLQLHQAPETTSNLLVKSVLRDHATFFYDGAIRVEKDAQKTDAYQRNENLLLSAGAHAESKPALEILANDVRCTHGATVATVSEEQLWYLASRGISDRPGKKLLVDGFLYSAFAGISDTILREDIKKRIWQTL